MRKCPMRNETEGYNLTKKIDFLYTQLEEEKEKNNELRYMEISRRKSFKKKVYQCAKEIVLKSLTFLGATIFLFPSGVFCIATGLKENVSTASSIICIISGVVLVLSNFFTISRLVEIFEEEEIHRMYYE